MQAYGVGFARVYEQRWGEFARQVAPLILDFYAATSIGRDNTKVLDLCCGAGHLAVHFLEQDYTVTGIDLSEHMLRYARQKSRRFIESGQASFVQGDVAKFKIEDRFGLVVSTYDSLNHLENLQALKDCFRCVHAVCDGYFVFDLNTRFGLRRWGNVSVDDSDDNCYIVTRGFFDGANDRALMRINGFVRVSDDKYERFEESVFNTIYDMESVRSSLLEVGWNDAYFARAQDLRTPIDEPEKEGRVFVVVRK